MNDKPLPAHVEQTVRAVEQVHIDHREDATTLDRSLEQLKLRLSKPSSMLALAAAILIWIVWNLWFGTNGKAWDPPPFEYLQLVLSIAAVFITVLILATQTRADKLASHREQLILHASFASEQKAGKIIALLEELRRDSPQVKDRIDPEAQEMTETMDTRAVSEALKEVPQQGSAPGD